MTFGLPEDVAALLRDRVDSYEELNILLLLRRELSQGWSAESLSERLSMPMSLVNAALARLQASQLVERTGAKSDVRYRFAPATAELRDAAGALAGVYAEHPLEIVKCLSDNAVKRLRLAALRTFADAFVLRKRK